MPCRIKDADILVEIPLVQIWELQARVVEVLLHPTRVAGVGGRATLPRQARADRPLVRRESASAGNPMKRTVQSPNFLE